MLFSFITHLLALLLAPLAQGHEVACWAPDGETAADNETYVPCNKLGIEQNGVESSCCNLDGKPDERDLCATSGLCLNSEGVYFRGYCTDKSWDSPACVKVCTDEKNGGSADGMVAITDCTDGTYCCGNNNLRCCGTEEAFELPTQASVVASNVTETSVVTQGAGVASSYKSATIGLAVVLGVTALSALGGILWLLRKNKALHAQLHAAHPAMEQTPRSQFADPYLQEDEPGTEITGGSSPRPGMGGGYIVENYKPPTSPNLPEVDGSEQRYSELDATGTTHRSYGSPATPAGFEHSGVPSPLQSPRHET